MQKTVIATALAALLAQGARAQTTPQPDPNSPQPAASGSSAPTAATPTGDARTTPAPTFVIAKFKAKLYGFAEFDTLWDQTQSFSEVQGNGIIAKPGTTQYQNARTQFSPRNSRLGFSLETPEVSGVKASATIEGDFFGFDPAPYSAVPSGNASQSEGGFYSSPTFRIRHAYTKIETPVLDIVAGQYWTLVGFGSTFNPATVALQGIVGEIYQRTTQFRVGKTLKLGGGSKLEIQADAQRPYQRDAWVPDLNAGVRFELGGWSGYKSTGGVASGLANLQLAVSGGVKQFRALNPVAGNTTDFQTASGSSVAVDALIPIIPATKDSHAGALTFVGEASRGTGDNDMFQSLNMGTSVGKPGGTIPAGYVGPNLDGGAAGFNTGSGLLDTVDYESLMLNLQYYTMIKPLWLSAVYSFMHSDNANQFGGTLSNIKYGSLAAFYDVNDAVRFGLEGVWTRQQMTDGSLRMNRRLLFSTFFVF